jgi:hypothetical protein
MLCHYPTIIMNEKNILVLIDNRIIGLDIKKQLERYGYNPDVKGFVGKEILKDTLTREFHLIILGNPTYEYESALEIAYEFKLPVIYLTTDSELQVIKQPDFRILMMPFSEDDLKEIVKSSLGDS